MNNEIADNLVLSKLTYEPTLFIDLQVATGLDGLFLYRLLERLDYAGLAKPIEGEGWVLVHPAGTKL